MDQPGNDPQPYVERIVKLIQERERFAEQIKEQIADIKIEAKRHGIQAKIINELVKLVRLGHPCAFPIDLAYKKWLADRDSATR